MVSPGEKPAADDDKGIYRLPIELRYQIYSSVWEPRTVILGKHTDPSDNLPSVPLGTQTPPVTLHLSHEAREETLKHYRKFSFVRDPEPFDEGSSTRFELYGYVHPYLDTIHFHPSVVSNEWSSFMDRPLSLPIPVRYPVPFTFDIEPPITRPLLRISFDSDLIPARIETLRTLMSCLCIPSVCTIDFWVTISRTCSMPSRSRLLGNADPQRASKTTSRFRLCRTGAAKVPVVKFEEVVFRPRNLGNNSWKWEDRPEETRALDSIPLDVGTLINLQSPETWPAPGAGQLRLPCAVSNWDEVQPRHLLKKNGVLMFDATPVNINPPDLTDAPARPERTLLNQSGWSLLKVVDPDDIWEREITALAFAHLFTFSPLVGENASIFHPLRSWIVGTGPRVLDIVHWLAWAEGEWHQIRREVQERAMVICEPVHGICTPEYMYGGEGGQGLVPVNKRCPVVSTPSLRELHCGRESVERDKDMFLVVPQHQEIVDRRYRAGPFGVPLFIYAA
ncbi:hypothetical protein QBC41DRAFT_341256 [Cercophora samala]|uniref:2EXR domain-containing protein n=1 Tax=Cercophora samala TaxID=330535 RepID=A0AA39YWC6_9PEZI|nr:hypothetical protein QBC41DRAFT_341256 [Cercophora samala]